MGFPVPPTPADKALLNVAISLLSVVPVRLMPPGTALATQLFVLGQVAPAGAFVQIWLAAMARHPPARRTSNIAPKRQKTIRTLLLLRRFGAIKSNALRVVRVFIEGFFSVGLVAA